MMNEAASNNGAQDLTTENSGTKSKASENSSTDANTRRPLNEADKRQAVADLFRGKKPPAAQQSEDDGQDDGQVDQGARQGSDDWFPEGDGQGEGQEKPKGPEKLTPSSLAEKLDTDAAAIYKMEVPLSDGTSVKLSDLKDLWQGRETAKAEIAKTAAGLNSREAKLIADQQVWSELSHSGKLPPEALERVQTQIQAQHRREQSILFDLVPELQDETKLDLFRRDLVRALGSVGYEPHQIVINDHRQALFVRKYVQMEKELDALRKAAKPNPPKARQGNGRPLQPAKPNRPTGHRDAITAAVSNILNGK